MRLCGTLARMCKRIFLFVEFTNQIMCAMVWLLASVMLYVFLILRAHSRSPTMRSIQLVSYLPSNADYLRCGGVIGLHVTGKDSVARSEIDFICSRVLITTETCDGRGRERE